MVATWKSFCNYNFLNDMKNVLIAQHPVWELLPYGRSSDLKENSIDLHMADTLHFKKFLFTSLCEFTNIFIRIVFKSTYSRVSYQSHQHFFDKKIFWKYSQCNFSTKSDKHMLYCFKRYSQANRSLIARKPINKVSIFLNI